MSTKAALKAAKAALDAGDYDTAVKEAQTVLASDEQNYFAKLFLGRAFEKRGKLGDAAKTYEAAAKSKPDDSQAWLGLCSVYEAQGSDRVDEYREAAVRAAEIFAQADDKHRCQTTIDKLVSFSKQNGTKAQYKRTVKVLLPGSSVYDFLEGRIPRPGDTYATLAEITEDEEAQTVKHEIAARRTRIGAKLGQVTADVKREVFARSDLEQLYQEVINWSSSDDVRRQYEEKLLERAYDTLLVLPMNEKVAKLDQVLTLAEGVVIIHHSFQLAWDIVLESRDFDDLRELDANVLREYMSLFPEEGLGKVLRGWMSSEVSPFPHVKNTEEESDEQRKQMSSEDRLILMTEGLARAEQSPFAYRLVGDFYLHLEEYETAADTARTGLKAVGSQCVKLGLTMQNTKDAINSVLATALVHYQAPRNHSEARRLFEIILERKPRWTPALIGLGLIFEENEQYQHAIEFLSRALDQDPGNVRVGTELAWCRALNGDYANAKVELEEYLPEMKADDPQARDLRAQVLYRIGVCTWEIDPSKAARKDRDGAYNWLLTAIKTNVNFAPAYTLLGTYYSDYAKDKKRARQCFQKAFELSPAETDAAKRLAKSFADQGDWDIVEVIAQRVIDTGRARPPPGSKRKGLSWPYSALGVVQMNKQEYQLAITSFLAALRISPDDYQSYVGLGESYHNSGRYNSALRTFNYALEPHDGVGMRVFGEKWFASYMLANVHRELGDYDEAIAGMRDVLKERPSEFGVLMSLLQTFVEQSWRCIETGLFGQAVDSACQAISTAVSIISVRANAFNVWKAVGDACMIFSWVQCGIDELPKDDLERLLNSETHASAYEVFEDVDQVELDTLGTVDGHSLAYSLIAGVLSYKRAIHSCSDDIHAQAVAWYNLGWAEHRAYISIELKPGRKYLKAAVRCFKRAIELEAANAEFWNGLGVVTTILNPKVAQHSFVRSLHLNELNAKVWTNLGVLYLQQNDHELAHQAFGRAQSTDPTYAHAWLGEGLIALLLGDNREALSHFTHAFEISDSSSLITKRQYALSVFDHLLATPSASNDLTSLIQPIFALEQLQYQSPRDLPYEHLAALLFERVGNHTAATESQTSLCAAAEANYEASESLAALSRFVHAKSDLARNHLATQDFESAASNAGTALDLTSDTESSGGLSAAARTKLRLSSHLTAGLSLHYLQRSSEAITMFKCALQESTSDPDVVGMLVRVLWAKGGEEEKSVAREQLFECVEKYPENVGCVTLLGAIAGLGDDVDTVSAVREDLTILRTKDGLSLSEQGVIDRLLASLASLTTPTNNDPSAEFSNDDPEINGTAALTSLKSSILLNPTHSAAWSELAMLSGEAHAAAMALKTAQKSVPPLGTMEAEDLARQFGGIRTAGDAQRGVVLAPWIGDGWEALGGAVGS